MRIPDPKANTTTEAYLAYKAGYLEESELKPKLYKPDWHFDGWLAYWAGLTNSYPGKKSLFYGRPAANYGITGSLSKDGVVSVVGTATATDGARVMRNDGFSLEAGTYTLSISEPQTSVVNLLVNTNNGLSVSFRIPAGSTSATNTIPDGSIAVSMGLFYGVVKGMTYNNSFKIQLIAGDAPDYDSDPYTTNPEMLCDEEALVAYLSGVTDTYPEDIKDPYDVRIVGYLKHLASIRWPEPDYPVNNEEFYLSTMEPTHTSNSEPSADMELDTAEGKIISVEAYGDTYQQTYSGKNLLLPNPRSSASNGITASYDATTGVITLSGTATANWSNAFIDVPVNLPAGTYTFSATTESGIGRNIIFFNGSTNILQKVLSATATSAECVVSEAITSLRLWLSPTNGTDYTGKTFKAQLEIGNRATSFEPYVGGVPAPNPDYPQDIQVVTGEQTVEVTGKNIVNLQGYSSYGVTSSINGDGSITISGTATSSGGVLVMRSQQPMKAGTYTMTISRPLPFLINFSVASGVSFRIPAGGTSVTTTLPGDYIDGGLYMAMTAGTTYNETFNLQVVAGSTPDYDFEPYHLQSYTVDLGPIELCSIGNYQDKIFNNDPNEDWYDPDLEDNAWYVHKEVNKQVLDGTENIYNKDTSSGFTRVYFPLTGQVNVGNARNTDLLSDYFNASDVNNYGTAFLNNARAYVYPQSTITTVEEFKTWLSSNNTTFYYPLATATDTQITDATLIGQLDALAGADTYNEKTFIGVTATGLNLPALLKVEAYKY